MPLDSPDFCAQGVQGLHVVRTLRSRISQACPDRRDHVVQIGHYGIIIIMNKVGRPSFFLTHNNTTKSLAEWARFLNTKSSVIKGRLKRGWLVSETLSIPINQYSQHKLSYHSARKSWDGMMRRCYNPRTVHFKDYGGRGIQVCIYWHSLPFFVKDMGFRPKGYTIERLDNNGHYSCGNCPQCIENNWPLNCKWASRKDQTRNRRSNHSITYQGKTQSITEWAEELNIPRGLLYDRITKRKWDVERAFTQTAQVKRRQQ